eukprot:7163385-Heterocapsa_arctica.AAC.1
MGDESPRVECRGYLAERVSHAVGLRPDQAEVVDVDVVLDVALSSTEHRGRSGVLNGKTSGKR